LTEFEGGVELYADSSLEGERFWSNKSPGLRGQAVSANLTNASLPIHSGLRLVDDVDPPLRLAQDLEMAT
jgi:hypothetical protein